MARYMTEGFRDLGKNESQDLLYGVTEQIAQDPTNAVALFERARCYSSLNNHQEALDDASGAFGLQRKWVEAWVLRAQLFSYLKDYGYAFVNYDVALKLDPRRAATYWSRARLYEYLAI